MLIDTSGLLCLHHRTEQFHIQACELYRSAKIRVIHNYVLAEFVALANARHLPRSTVITFLVDLQNNPDIEMIWIDESLHNEAITLLLSRLDKTYSLCDAVSFVVMRRRGIVEALTSDRHFEQEGFRRLFIF